MRMSALRCGLPALLGCAAVLGAAVPFDTSGLQAGPVKVTSSAESVSAEWPDAGGNAWRAEFSLDPQKPLITSVGRPGRNPVIEQGRPNYRCEFGTRHRGWDEFFDFPAGHTEGTRRFPAIFHLTAARAKSVGDRVELFFDGLQIGPFTGGVAFTIYPGSRLIEQEAVVSTREPNTTYYYDAGMNLREPSGAGDAMQAEVSFYDTAGRFRTIRSGGPERQSLQVHYRALALATRGGTVVAFPAPHQYFMPRDFTTNIGFIWHFAWRGVAGIGIRQYPDDNTAFYPWMNAPPGTEQRLGVFFLLSDANPGAALADVLRYTHSDRFPRLAGYRTFSPHWHPDFTVQAMEHGAEWVPPFKPVLKQMGVDAMLVFDFHMEGHPNSVEPVRLQELAALYKACRAQSDPQFLIIPGEEANVWLGGHYGLIFSKPVFWFKQRSAGTPLSTKDPTYGNVWHIGSAEDMLEMVRAERGYVYQAHPRIKGSLGFPDKIRDTAWFRDPRFFGLGWKAIPADLSSPRLGERAFKAVDDANNWGTHKLLVSEVDVFQVDSTHELYGHMNVNYLRLAKLPDFAHYGDVLEAMVKGDSFMTTGEILLPEVKIAASGNDGISVQARVSWTFPLRMAEVVWGDGSETRRQIFPLESTHEFGAAPYEWRVNAPRWKWARMTVWDVAGDGAFTEPVWRTRTD